MDYSRQPHHPLNNPATARRSQCSTRLSCLDCWLVTAATLQQLKKLLYALLFNVRSASYPASTIAQTRCAYRPCSNWRLMTVATLHISSTNVSACVLPKCHTTVSLQLICSSHSKVIAAVQSIVWSHFHSHKAGQQSAKRLL